MALTGKLSLTLRTFKFLDTRMRGDVLGERPFMGEYFATLLTL